MNNILVQHYLSLNPISNEVKHKIHNPDPLKLWETLNTFAQNWTYEIENEQYNDNIYNVTVVLYLPGTIKIGCSSSIMEGYYRNKTITDALLNALITLTVQSQAPQPDNSDKPIEKPLNETPGVTVQGGIAMLDPKGSESPASQTSYTPEQIARMKKFKDDYKITTQDQFMSYVKTWNPNIQNKRELTPDKVDTFLDWVNNLASNVM